MGLSNNTPRNDATRGEARYAFLRWFFRILAVALALARIFVGRNTIGPDPRAYMELARAILRHDWPMVVNSYWSALYPWWLAAGMWLVKPSLRQEFPLAHALALPLYLLCIAAFEFFWTSLLGVRKLLSEWPRSPGLPIPTMQMWVLGYSIFIWMTIGELILLITPDMCVTVIVLLAAGLLLRMEITLGAQRRNYLWLGICLGIGYLTKAILFPMAFIFLGVMILVSRRPIRRNVGSFALAGLAFAALAAPQIALLSRAKGHFTFSETGKLNIAWFNYGFPYRNWQGQPAGNGTPLHPTRKIYNDPAVYEFNGPLRASYPPWFDPTYWNEGLSPAFNLGKVTKNVVHVLSELGSEFLHPAAWLAGMLLLLAGADFKKTWRGIAAYRPLILISIAAYAAYSFTLMQSRFLPPWELLLWGSFLAGIRLRESTASLSRWVVGAVSVALIAAMLRMAYAGFITHFPSDASPEYATAEGLQKMGVQPGAKVGVIGFDNDAYWPYLAHFDVVAEINTNETCLFWSKPEEIQTQVLQKFADSGVSVVVANTGGGVKSTSTAVPLHLDACARPGRGWRQIDGSPNHAFFLK